MKVFAVAMLGLGLFHVEPPQDTQAPQSPAGTVLFSTDKGEPTQANAPGTTKPVPEITAADRNAPTFTRYNLEVHLTPATAQIAVRSGLEVRNDGTQPLRYLPLQISSTLNWDTLTLETGGKGAPVTFVQHLVDTDADHTGKANEAIITLLQPLAPGASLSLSAFYSGEIHPSAERLERIGAPLAQAESADWDQISPESTALRGFGNVLWYPTASEPVFLGDGAKLFQAVGRDRLRQARSKAHLRLTVQYVGDAPDSAFFCSRREKLIATSENQNLPIAESPGVATAAFDTETLGFRSPSLFVTDRAATVTNDTLIAAVTDHYDAVPQYAAAAALAKPLLMEWLGPTPLGQLMIIDHAGQPFEDGNLLVLPMHTSSAATLAPSLVHTLAHLWFHSVHAWLDEGVPQLLSLLWTEQGQGRPAVINSLQQAANTLALAEPEIKAADADKDVGQSLIAATDDVYYRTKAAAVLWQLRSLAGDDALKQTLLIYRKGGKQDEDPLGFETMLEKYSHKDLHWFFEDWVYHDRGLPDLSIVNVTPRELPAKNGRPTGWLVSAEVRNDGDAVADVPVTVRSGTLSATERLRIQGHTTASTRILFESTPEEVQVNDGTVPELRTSTHTIQIKPKTS